MFRIILLCLLGLSTASCSVTLTSDENAYTFPSAKVVELKSGTKVKVINLYPKSEVIALKTDTQVFGDLHQFTSTAVAIVKREIAKKGLIINDTADKTITLKVINPTWDHSFLHQVGSITLEVKLGSGKAFTLKDTYSTLGNGYRAINGAMLGATTKLLQDSRLAEYLNKP